MMVRITKGEVAGIIAPPASKSILHRLVLASSLAKGKSFLSGCDLSDDIKATLRATSSWSTSHLNGRDLLIKGRGGVKHAARRIDCGESGTTLRLILPLLALTGSMERLTGCGRLLSRPLAVYEELFKEKSVSFTRDDNEIKIQGPLPAGDYTIPGNVSSQFASGLIFALPLALGDSTLTITPPVVSRDYITLSLEVVRESGIVINEIEPYTYKIPGGQAYKPLSLRVEADWSQAAPFLVLGALRGGVAIAGLDPTSHQGDKRIMEIINESGGRVSWNGSLLSSDQANLKGFTVDLSQNPDLAPYLFVASAFASSPSHFSGVSRLRDKESDRLSIGIMMLEALGAKCKLSVSELIVTPGVPPKGTITLKTAHDHRLVQAAAIASAKLDSVRIEDAEAINKSYPRFFRDLEAFGFTVTKD